jgi:hypothetical protein
LGTRVALNLVLSTSQRDDSFVLGQALFPSCAQNTPALDLFDSHNDVGPTQDGPPIGAQFVNKSPSIKPLRFIEGWPPTTKLTYFDFKA